LGQECLYYNNSVFIILAPHFKPMIRIKFDHGPNTLGWLQTPHRLQIFYHRLFLVFARHIFTTRSSSKVYGLPWQFIRSSRRYHLPAGKGKIFWIASTDKAHLGFGKGTRRIGQPWDKRVHKLLFRDRAVKPA